MENRTTVSGFDALLSARGVSRRSFLKLCGAIAAAAGLSQLAVPRVAQALEESVIGATSGDLYPVIWIEGASCTGCTESFVQVETPDAATIILEMISLNYSETLSAAAGYSMEEAKEQTIAAGDYLLICEGAVLRGFDGNAMRVAEKVGTEILAEAAESANAVVAIGSCAVNGGWMAAYPNSADAMGVQQYLEEVGIDTPVVNIPGCPVNPEWIMSVLVDVVLMEDAGLLDLNMYNMPADIFDQTIHDNCERRGHFENGEFVYKLGSEEEAKGYCLYPLGCRGPQTKSNCGITLWNNRRSWCVQAGGPCIGCCEANPEDPGQNWVEVNTPFRERHRMLRIGGLTFEPTTLAVAVTVIVAALLAIHGFGMKRSGRMDGGAGFEKIRKWDKKHPDRSIGTYADPVEGGPVIDKELVEENTKTVVSDEDMENMVEDLTGDGADSVEDAYDAEGAVDVGNVEDIGDAVDVEGVEGIVDAGGADDIANVESVDDIGDVANVENVDDVDDIDDTDDIDDVEIRGAHVAGNIAGNNQQDTQDSQDMADQQEMIDPQDQQQEEN